MAFWDRLLGKEPAVQVYLYTKNATTIRGTLLAVRAGRYELAACSVAPDGSDNFKPVMGRVCVPEHNVDWYTVRFD